MECYGAYFQGFFDNILVLAKQHEHFIIIDGCVLVCLCVCYHINFAWNNFISFLYGIQHDKIFQKFCKFLTDRTEQNRTEKKATRNESIFKFDTFIKLFANIFLSVRKIEGKGNKTMFIINYACVDVRAAFYACEWVST